MPDALTDRRARQPPAGRRAAGRGPRLRGDRRGAQRHLLPAARDRGPDLRRPRALGRHPARLYRAAVARAGALFRAWRLPLRARPQGGAVVLAGAGRRARRRIGARARRRPHRDPRARRLLRADHLRPGAGGRQGGLQHPRARRVGRPDRRADHRHRSGPGFGVERVAGRLLPGRAGRHHRSATRCRPICSTRRSAAC